MKTIYLRHDQIKRIQEITATAESLPMLQFAYFVGAVKQEFGEELANDICEAAKNKTKLYIELEERN